MELVAGWGSQQWALGDAVVKWMAGIGSMTAATLISAEAGLGLSDRCRGGLAVWSVKPRDGDDEAGLVSGDGGRRRRGRRPSFLSPSNFFVTVMFFVTQ